MQPSNKGKVEQASGGYKWDTQASAAQQAQFHGDIIIKKQSAQGQYWKGTQTKGKAYGVWAPKLFMGENIMELRSVWATDKQILSYSYTTYLLKQS